MFDIDKELRKIEACKFFDHMGEPGFSNDPIIYIENVRKVFIEPSDIEFQGRYNDVEWLPTSPTQIDPFYKLSSGPQELIELRMKINKAVMIAVKAMGKSAFISGAHDFSIAAKGGLSFAFRQYVTEQYYGLGDNWEKIVGLYYEGRWPVGYFKGGLIVI